MSDENKDDKDKDQNADDKQPDIKNKKVKFDAEQVVVVNGLYAEAWAKAAEVTEKTYKAQLEAEKAEKERLAAEKATMEQQLAEARAAAEKAAGDKDKKKDDPPMNIEDHPAFKALRDQMQAQMEENKKVFDNVKEERDTLRKQNEAAKAERKKARKKDQFLGALKDANVTFFDPIEAYELAEKEGLEYDEDNDRVIVKSGNGVVRLNENGEPMNAVDFVKDFATKKKYLVKNTDAGGFGSRSSDKLLDDKDKNEKKKDWGSVTPEEFEAERQRIMTRRQ
jgi:hypothetical protein